MAHFRRFAKIMLMLGASLVFAPPTSHAATARVYSFGVVPQQSATELAKAWAPLLEQLSKASGVKLRFATAPDIPAFEKRLAAGQYDFAYMNPYHYSVFHKRPGYAAFAREKERRLKGIVVVRKDSPYKDIAELRDQSLAFPAPAAFAATVLVQAEFARVGVAIKPRYVSSHDSVYLGVAKGLYPAGGGVTRTLENMDVEVRDQLRVLWTSKAYTPHPFAAHPRVPAKTVEKVAQAMFALHEAQGGPEVLKGIGFKAIEPGQDKDWDDVRGLNISLLDAIAGKPVIEKQ
jgi:phosphonate transport system substrate-binding protein